MNKLKIIHLSTSDTGGAGIASRYLNELFNREGHHSKLVVKRTNRKRENIISLKSDLSDKLKFQTFRALNKLGRLLKKKHIDVFDKNYHFYNFSEDITSTSAQEILKKIDFTPNVIVLHWVSNFINSHIARDLQQITKAKIFWVMMDNAPITGGCHYQWNCEGYKLDCAICPAILDSSKKDLAQNNLSLKKSNLPRELEFIALSEGDFIRLKNASIAKNRKIHKVLFPMDENKFKPPLNKFIAKEELGLDPNKKVIFYGSSSLIDYRKGGEYLLKSLPFLEEMLKMENIPLESIQIFIAGNSGGDLFDNVNFPVIIENYLSEENLIKAYQAADIFVSTSLEDSGPLMVNQAIMCGTPVVSFGIGVALDLVVTGKTGYEVKWKDPQDLANGMNSILQMDRDLYQQMSENCKLLGLQLLQSKIQINKLIKIISN